MFVETQMGGADFAFPDTCNVPEAAGAPVPNPLPNMNTCMTSIPPAETIFVSGMPVHTLITQGTISDGDEAGVELGTVSFLIKGPSHKLFGSFTIFADAQPVIKMTNPTGQNGISMNAPGANLIPSQFTVLALT